MVQGKGTSFITILPHLIYSFVSVLFFPVSQITILFSVQIYSFAIVFVFFPVKLRFCPSVKLQ
ncbi:hypothetical protein Hanom_Chr06g00570091 [Helianthus anomalus]